MVPGCRLIVALAVRATQEPAVRPMMVRVALALDPTAAQLMMAQEERRTRAPVAPVTLGPELLARQTWRRSPKMPEHLPLGR